MDLIIAQNDCDFAFDHVGLRQVFFILHRPVSKRLYGMTGIGGKVIGRIKW